MAHECPDCGCICRCCGDIDDIVFGVDYGCIHCEHDDDDDWEDEDWGDEDEDI